MAKESRIKDMIDNAVHIGHQTQKWNPKMRKFIYGSKNGIHIFDLEKTVQYLDGALEYVKYMVSQGKTVLFVSTKPQAATVIIDVAQKTQMPYVVNKWMPGLLTNFSTMKRRIKFYNDLVEQEKNGDFDKYTKKEASKLRKEIEKLNTAFYGVKDLNKLPDVVFLVDVVKDKIVMKEAQKMRIPVVAITDTNADPDGVYKMVPGNDDALSSIKFLVGDFEKVIQEAKNAKVKK